MSRYTGPRVKKMRALGTVLPGLSRKTNDRRPYPPGQHGQNRRRKESDFGKQLKEKQKLRLNYGITERQMRRLMRDARASKTATGIKLLELLERRLDNVVFRSGFAPTIPAARQLINHGHVFVNGRRVDIPSYRVEISDVVAPSDKALKLQVVQDSLGELSLLRPDWFSYNESNTTTRIESLPDADAVPLDIDVQLVVEYYSKRM